MKEVKGHGMGKKSKPPNKLEVGPSLSLPINIALSGPGVASTSRAGRTTPQVAPLAGLGLSSASFGQGPPPDPAPLPQDQ